MYKKGDKFIIEISDIDNKKEHFYNIKGFDSYSFSEGCFDSLDRLGNMKTYEQGLEDAWAAAGAIGKLPKDGGLDLNELAQIFGTPHTVSIFNGFTADEAIAKIKAYEDERHKV